MLWTDERPGSAGIPPGLNVVVHRIGTVTVRHSGENTRPRIVIHAGEVGVAADKGDIPQFRFRDIRSGDVIGGGSYRKGGYEDIGAEPVTGACFLPVVTEAGVQKGFDEIT